MPQVLQSLVQRAGWIGAIASLLGMLFPITVAAQIAGDDTVGTQVNGSLTDTCLGTCSINGGIERGVNLYYSFYHHWTRRFTSGAR